MDVASKPLQEYLKLQGRFNYLSDGENQRISAMIEEHWQELLCLSGDRDG